MDKVKTYFLGCPTPDGFSTHIHKDINSDRFSTYIIKGGPGTGKSSLMKKVAKELSAVETPELYFCSSDPASLDAVVFRKSGIIIIDGTSPHVVEPDYPGVKEILVDLGECWDRQKLKDNKEEIISATVRNKKCHAVVRRYLKAITTLNEDVKEIGDACINRSKLDSYCKRVSARLFPLKKSKTGSMSLRQITSVTPEGVITHGSAFEGMNVFKINDHYSAVAYRLLRAFAESAEKMGYDVIVGTDVFGGNDCYRQVIIPEISIAFTSEDDVEGDIKINALRFYDRQKLREKRKKVAFNKQIAGELTAEIITTLKEAKTIHDELESYYIAAMDFKSVDKVADKLVKEIRMKIER